MAQRLSVYGVNCVPGRLEKSVNNTGAYMEIETPYFILLSSYANNYAFLINYDHYYRSSFLSYYFQTTL